MAGRRWTKDEEETLIAMNAEGYNYREISDVLGRSLASCQQRGRNVLGLNGDQNVNESFFERNDREMHYVLGYWLADGYITHKGGGWYFGLTSVDKGHLEKVGRLMDFKGNITNRKNSNAHDIIIGNKNLVNSMIEIGCDYNKTHTMELNDLEFNDRHFFDLLRGFFDGDGSYAMQTHVKANGTRSISSINFTGARKMIESIQRYIGYGLIREDTRKNHCVYLSFYGDEMRRLLHKMYENSTIHLDRKYKIYNEQGIQGKVEILT